jgi:hypothetical protein
VLLRGHLAVVAVFAAFGLLPAGASGATICVHEASSSCQSTATDIQAALNEAADSPADDRVVIGPGRFEGGFDYLGPEGSGRIEVVGQGPSTVLTAPSGTAATTVLEVGGDPQGDGSLVSDLTVRVPSNTNATGDTGIASGAVSNVRVSSDANGPAGAEAVGVALVESGGSMRNSVVEMVDGGTGSYGVRTQGSAATPTTISDSRVIAPVAILAAGQTTTVVRDRISSGGVGVSDCNALVTVEDSLIRLSSHGTGLRDEGANQCGTQQALMFARQMTIVGTGTANGQVGAEVNARIPSQTPGMEVSFSIVRGVEKAFSQVAESSGVSVLLVSATDFEGQRWTRTEAGGNVNGGGGSIFYTDADPLFTDELLGNFTLRSGSPAIDFPVSPPLAADESATDLAGNPRIVDGNGNGIAERDQGAFEAPAPPAPPDTTPPDTRIQMPKQGKKKLFAGRHGYPLRVAFASTEPGSDFECRLDVGRFVPCSSPFEKRLAAGLHRFEVRAVDAAGNVDPTPARESLRISRAPHKARRGHHHRPL